MLRCAAYRGLNNNALWGGRGVMYVKFEFFFSFFLKDFEKKRMQRFDSGESEKVMLRNMLRL